MFSPRTSATALGLALALAAIPSAAGASSETHPPRAAGISRDG